MADHLVIILTYNKVIMLRLELHGSLDDGHNHPFDVPLYLHMSSIAMADGYAMSSSAAAGKHEDGKPIKKRNSLTSSAVGASAALFDNDTFIFRRAVTLLRIRYASLRATSCFRTEVFPPCDNKKKVPNGSRAPVSPYS